MSDLLLQPISHAKKVHLVLHLDTAALERQEW